MICVSLKLQTVWCICQQNIYCQWSWMSRLNSCHQAVSGAADKTAATNKTHTHTKCLQARRTPLTLYTACCDTALFCYIKNHFNVTVANQPKKHTHKHGVYLWVHRQCLGIWWSFIYMTLRSVWMCSDNVCVFIWFHYYAGTLCLLMSHNVKSRTARNNWHRGDHSIKIRFFC